MTTKHTPTPCGAQKRHPFSFTLGEGPYKFVGDYDLGRAIAAVNNGTMDTAHAFADAPKLEAGMGTCAHCGHAILNVMIIRRGDGKLYGVGSDCVRKVAAEGDVSAISDMERKIRAAAKKQRRDKEAAKVSNLEADYQAALIILERGMHPNDFFAKKGKTMADYYRFCSKNSRNMKAAISDAAAIAKAKGEA